MLIHTLANGATVLVLSPGHGFKFSDGTACGPQAKELCDKLTLERKIAKLHEIKGMPLVSMTMSLSPDQEVFLDNLSRQADIVLVPFPVIVALREQGIRQNYPNVVAMNATPETQRSAPADKVVDINNWSY